MSQYNTDEATSIITNPLTANAADCVNMKVLVKTSTGGTLYVKYTVDNLTWYDDTTYPSTGTAVTTGDIISLGDISPFTIVSVEAVAGTVLDVVLAGHYDY